MSSRRNDHARRASHAGRLTFRRELRPQDLKKVTQLARASGVFSEDEVGVAAELVDERLRRGAASGYEFLFAEQADRLLGYTCFGPIPCTQASFDLYWIVVDPAHQNRGIGREL